MRREILAYFDLAENIDGAYPPISATLRSLRLLQLYYDVFTTESTILLETRELALTTHASDSAG